MVFVSPIARVGITAFAVLLCGQCPLSAQTCFSADERASVLEFWNSKAKYFVEPATLDGREWTVRLTPTGSKWIREVYRQFQATKVNPTQDPNGNTAEQREWTAWIDRQVKRDWAVAEQKAVDLNAGVTNVGVSRIELPKADLQRRVGTDKIGQIEPSPEPIADDECPSELIALVGPAPCFAAPVRPLRHNIDYPDGQSLSYVDNVKVRAKYAYYRFADGVNSGGQSIKSLSESETAKLFRSAGISSKEQKVMKAVSLLEGGFDSINTYDTGFVSVGFIQFACLADGTGSLGRMMASYKSSNPKGFDQDFRRFGIDVVATSLVALDLETGAETTGPDAALQLIRDKRLISVFQRAGLMSSNYRVAQLQAAKFQFYPGDDKVCVSLNGTDCTVRLGDIFRTEAGLATLMDRKVNTGKISGLKECIETAATKYGITNPNELHLLEFVLARELSYRTDYIASTALARPRDNSQELSRRGSRFDRNKGKGDPASGGGSRKGSRSGRK